MNLDDRSLEELSGLFLEEDAAECEEDLARIAAERGLPSDPPVAETLLRSGRISAAQLAELELLGEARKRRSNRVIEALKAGRDADLSRARRFGR